MRCRECESVLDGDAEQWWCTNSKCDEGGPVLPSYEDERDCRGDYERDQREDGNHE